MRTRPVVVIDAAPGAEQLGSALDEDGYVITDHAGATSHPLVWAAGDVRRPAPAPHQVVLAAADGSTAAIAMHKAFVAGRLGKGAARPEELSVNHLRRPSGLTPISVGVP